MLGALISYCNPENEKFFQNVVDGGLLLLPADYWERNFQEISMSMEIKEMLKGSIGRRQCSSQSEEAQYSHPLKSMGH